MKMKIFLKLVDCYNRLKDVVIVVGKCYLYIRLI